MESPIDDLPTDEIHRAAPPVVTRDAAFWGLGSTQFLGAFNDNLFKQMVFLLCLDLKHSGGPDYQSICLALFALPFVACSGFAGFLSDRFPKRRIIVVSKVAEILVMALGAAALFAGMDDDVYRVRLLLGVLCLMGMQSAFFGPSKYGVLPELFRARDLPMINGVIQMTTFLAIIFGTTLAGIAIDRLHDEVWIVSVICIALAFVGTLTSLLIRPTPVAEPGIRLRLSSFGIDGSTWRLLREDRTLMNVLLVSSLFWFIGGVVQPVANEMGHVQMGLSRSRASMLLGCTGIGIAIGCVAAGRASRHRIRPGMVTIGAAGIVASLVLIAVVAAMSPSGEPIAAANELANLAKPAENESIGSILIPQHLPEWLSRIAFTSLGLASGFFVVPLQVFLQARPPLGQKGRMIGAMNLLNWIGIVFSAGFHAAVVSGLHARDLPISYFFPILAAFLLPVALFYRAPEQTL